MSPYYVLDKVMEYWLNMVRNYREDVHDNFLCPKSGQWDNMCAMKFEVFPCSSLREIGVIEKVERMNW